jgi:hypothetical protein
MPHAERSLGQEHGTGGIVHGAGLRIENRDILPDGQVDQCAGVGIEDITLFEQATGVDSQQ